MFHWVVRLQGTPKRYFHASVSVGHRVFSFGGFCEETYEYNWDQIDVYVFNTVSFLWTKFPPSATTGGDPPLEVPSTRCCHTAVLIDGVVYIWGGIVNIEKEEDAGNRSTIKGDYCGALYAFDVSTHGWSKPEVSGTIPKERLGHSACLLGKVMYIYGGFNHLTGYTNDIHKLDTTTMVWSLMTTQGTPPPASLYHSATLIGTKIFVFGGLVGDDQRNHYNSIGVLDTETSRWLSTPSAQLLPEGRRCHSAFAYNEELYICGGITFDQSFNDCWKINPETFSWKKIETTGLGMFTMCCCMVEDHFVLFEEDISDDLYILDLNPSLKTLCKLAAIRYGLEQSGLPHDIRWELAAMTTTISNG